ncbi:cupin domain-containing protein [Saccharopolyspora sp. NPDC002376]
MHVFRAEHASRVEPPGHYGGLAVSDVVPIDVGANFTTQLSYCPPGGGGHSHHHAEDAQVFVVIKGELTFDTGTEKFTLHEQEAVMFAPFEDHATHNYSDSESVSVVITVRQP